MHGKRSCTHANVWDESLCAFWPTYSSLPSPSSWIMPLFVVAAYNEDMAAPGTCSQRRGGWRNGGNRSLRGVFVWGGFLHKRAADMPLENLTFFLWSSVQHQNSGGIHYFMLFCLTTMDPQFPPPYVGNGRYFLFHDSIQTHPKSIQISICVERAPHKEDEKGTDLSNVSLLIDEKWHFNAFFLCFLWFIIPNTKVGHMLPKKKCGFLLCNSNTIIRLSDVAKGKMWYPVIHS